MTADDILGEYRIVALCNGSWTSVEIEPHEFSDRDIAMVEINSDFANFVTKTKDSAVNSAPLAHPEDLIRRAACKKDKEFVLIGKDTGEKRRWQKTLPLKELYNAIDAMPMRRFEMRQRGEN